MKQKIEYYKKTLKESKLYGVISRHPRRTELAAVSLFFAALAALFMGPILFHFGSAVHGFWGDGTGGLIWLTELNLPLFGGQTDAVVYPYGDNLFRPDFITASLFMIPFWIGAKLIGAVATWNLTIFVSFWLCGVSMYYLVKRLTMNRMAALWAGVAFAYLPMHQYKAFGHIAYVLTFIFVFVLWQVLNFAARPTRRNAALLGLAFAVPFYVDGYYVLFTLILVGVPLLWIFLRALWRLSNKTANDFKDLLKSLGVFLGTSFAALLPIVYFKLVYGAQISAGLAMARGDFMSNVTVYTARWYDFVLPIETHPIFGSWSTAFRSTHNHGSNTSEHTLYLGFVLLGLVFWTTYFFWTRRKAKKVKETQVSRQSLVILGLVALVALAITLQPFIHVFGYRIPMPSGVLSVFVQYWRVYARLIIIIHLVLVVVGAVGLAILLGRLKSRAASWALAALLILVTFVEYLSFNPFHRQDIWYYDKLSSANTWLAKQKDIEVIAVYPLVDQPNGLASLYTTEQHINDKKMVNSGTVTVKQARLRASIAGLNDPQTLSVLKALGVQAVMTHEVPSDKKVGGLKLAYSAHEAPAGYAADVDVFRISSDISPARYALVPIVGVKDVTGTDLRTKHYVNGEGLVELKLELMPGQKPSTDGVRVSFTLASDAAYKGNDIVVTLGDQVIDTIGIGAGEERRLTYTLKESESLRLSVVGAPAQDSLYIKDLVAGK
jgi:hypothetical protein